MFRALLLLIAVIAPACAAEFPLKFDRLSNAIGNLSAKDRQIVDQSIDLIKKDQHNLAIIQLRELIKANDSNGGIRVLLAYALLNIGNRLGAFDEAKKAERAAHDSYVCLFLAKVAYAVGDNAACKREIQHVRAAKDPDAGELDEIEKKLAQKAK